MKEHKIGEVFTHNGVKLRVEEGLCINCDFRTETDCRQPKMLCGCLERTDNKSVIFKKVEE